MKVTKFTRKALAFRRERRALLKAGYRMHETDWEIHRGHATGRTIVDAKVSACGMYVYTKLSSIFCEDCGDEILMPQKGPRKCDQCYEEKKKNDKERETIMNRIQYDCSQKIKDNNELERFFKEALEKYSDNRGERR